MQPRFLSEPLRRAGGPILRLQSDDRLVRLVRAGSHPAFAELVHRYRPALVRHAGRLVGAQRAEDVVQQGLANAHTMLVGDDRPIDVRPWLYRIVHNAALNLLRTDLDRVSLDEHEHELVVDGVDVEAAGRERLRSTLRAVQALPTAQRDALLLRELEGRSHEEIAAALGVTAGAARQHLMRARATVRAVASAIIPYPLVLKLAGMGATTGAATLPAAEVVAGAGLGLGLSKLGVGVLAAGALAGGAGIVVPAVHPAGSADRTPRAVAGLAPADDSAAAAARRTASVQVRTPATGAASARPPGRTPAPGAQSSARSGATEQRDGDDGRRRDGHRAGHRPGDDDDRSREDRSDREPHDGPGGSDAGDGHQDDDLGASWNREDTRGDAIDDDRAVTPDGDEPDDDPPATLEATGPGPGTAAAAAGTAPVASSERLAQTPDLGDGARQLQAEPEPADAG